MGESRKAQEPEIPETLPVEIGRQYKNWLADFVALRGDEAMTERIVLERLFYHFRRSSKEEQEAILQGDNTRPFNRIGEILEVLPVTARVFRQSGE